MDFKSWRPSGFSFYDLFGYLLPGVFLVGLFIFEYDVGDLMKYYDQHKTFENLTENDIESKLNYLLEFLSWNSQGDFKFTTLLFFIIYCYLLGHMLGALASVFYERFFVSTFLKFPSENLFGKTSTSGKECLGQIKKCSSKKLQGVFYKFTQPLSSKFANDLEDLIKQRFGDNVDRKNYFWLCYTDITKYSPVAYHRIMRFLNLYGFSRNLSFGLLCYVIVRLGFYAFLDSVINIFNCVILTFYIILALVLFWNYLKLYRRQAQELYFHFYTLHRKVVDKDGIQYYSTTI